MAQSVKYQLAIVLAVAAVLFINLGVPRLWDEDEPRNASCAREMMDRGDWITPTFNGQLRTDKPILLYWLMRASYGLFGPTEFGARFWSATLALGTALCTFRLGRILFSPRAGLWAGLAVGTALMFDVAGRAATPDSTLIFFTTLSLLCFARSAMRQPPAARDPWTTMRWRDFLPVYAAMGMAVLAKGPVGVLLPSGVIGLYLMWLHGAPAATDPRPGGLLGWYDRGFAFCKRMLSPRSFAACLWGMRPFTLLAVVALIALPWYIAVGVETRGEWLKGFLWKHNIERFSGAMEGHAGGVWYYVPAILLGFFPWSVFLPLSLVDAGWRISTHDPRRRSYVFLICWVGLYVGLFSVAGTKLPSYVLPCYPALALLCGAFLEQVITRPALIGRWWMPASFATVALVGLGLLIGLPIALAKVLPGEGLLAVVGVAPLVGGIVALVLWQIRRESTALAAFSLTAVLLGVSLFAGASVRISRYQNSAPLAESIRQTGGREAQVATFAFLPSSLVFYAGHVDVFHQPEEVAAFFAAHEDAYLVTLGQSLDRVQPALPRDVVVLRREPRFLKRDEEVVLLGRSTETTDRRASSSYPHRIRR